MRSKGNGAGGRFFQTVPAPRKNFVSRLPRYFLLRSLRATPAVIKPAPSSA